MRSALLAFVLFLPQISAQAQNRTWVGGTGSWDDPANWSGSAVPDSSTPVRINNSGTATLSAGVSGAGGTMYLGQTAAGSLLINGGILSNFASILGFDTTGVGTATVSSGTWSHSTTLSVGYLGRGTLLVNGGLVSNTVGYIGHYSGGSGTATVSSGTWRNSGDLYVGHSGRGTLRIDGGLVSNFISYIGANANSTGTVTASSGTWQNASSVYVGYSGTGSLLVDGGLVTGYIGMIGYNTSASGAVTVTSGTWSNSRDIYVGYSGKGTLLINGGLVSSLGGSIGHLSTTSGTATVSSGTWHSTAELFAGYSGTGLLLITGNGVVDAPSVVLARNNTAAGTLILDGGELVTGSISEGAGSGTLTFNGGILRAAGNHSDFLQNFEAGDVTIASGGSFIDTNGFSVGVSTPISGAGGLTKLGEGTLSFTGNNNYAGGTTIKSGTLAVSGSEASINHGTQSVLVGETSGDQAAFVLREGGSALSFWGFIGGTTGSHGTALVSGGTWINNEQLHVGFFGTGTLLINGGLVSNTIGFIGTNGNSSGTATVNSGTWANSQDLLVGYSGTGSLLLNGGLVSNTAGLIGTSVGSHGAVTVTSGTWTNSGDLSVGFLGTGSLRIDGGLVSSNYANIGFFMGSNGTATVSSGTWANANTLSVGSSGTGTLSITDEGIVSVGAGSGTSVLAANGGSYGTLNIGTGGTAGSLLAQEVIGGDGVATVNFNHTGTHFFLPRLAGSLSVQKLGTGLTVLTGSNTYTGGTTVSGGTLLTTTADALGTGAVNLNGGELAPVGELTITSLNWTGGTITSTLGTTTSLVDISGNLTLGSPGQFVFLEGVDFAGNTPYAILTAANLNTFTIADFTAGALGGIVPLFEIIGDTLWVSFNGGVGGPVIQNTAPYFTPMNADFVVEGPVVTGGPNDNNTINSLTFMPGSSLQIFNTLTVTSANFTVPTGSATVTGGNVIVPGAFSKWGAGLLNIFSNVFVQGQALVQQGTLLVNGMFTAPGGLTVFQNAFLGGAGLINGSVINHGIVSPGNSPGVFTINGDFTQSGSGTLQVEFGDLLLVSGNASLTGTLQYLGGRDLQYGQQIGFLRAGSITGEFDQILLPEPSRFRGRFLAESGVGALLVAPTSYALVAETTNQRNVAQALNNYIPARGNDRETVSIALDLQSEEQYPAAFDQIAPTYYESLGNIVLAQSFAQTQQIYQRLSAVRLGAQGFQAIGMDNEPLRHDKDGKSVMEAKELVEPSTVRDPRWSLWAMGNGLFGRVTNVSQVPNNNFNSGGFQVGADYRWSENFATGLFGGYQYTRADAGEAGNTQINSALFGGYATYASDGFYADAVLSGGYDGYRTRRGITFSTIERTARSTPNGGQFNSALNLGHDWKFGKFTFGPIAGAQYTYVGITPFREDGADSLDLRVGQQNVNSLRITFGGRMACTWNLTEQVALIPEVRMSWQHEFLNNPRNISSALDGGAGPSFGYETSAPARDSIFAGAGVSAQFGPNWNAFFYYNIDFGRQDYLGNMISGGFNWRF